MPAYTYVANTIATTAFSSSFTSYISIKHTLYSSIPYLIAAFYADTHLLCRDWRQTWVGGHRHLKHIFKAAGTWGGPIQEQGWHTAAAVVSSLFLPVSEATTPSPKEKTYT